MIVIQTLLICNRFKDTADCIGTYASGDAVDRLAYEQRKRAMNDGWIRVDSKDYCPVCARAFATQSGDAKVKPKAGKGWRGKGKG